MRPVRVSLSVAVINGTQLPAIYISLQDTKEDTINISRSVVAGATAKFISVRAPRGTDFGDWASDNSPVFVITAANFYNGNITASGTVWIEYAPHKVTTKVALLGPFTSPLTEDVPPVRGGTTQPIRRGLEGGGSPPQVGEASLEVDSASPRLLRSASPTWSLISSTSRSVIIDIE